MSEFIQEPRPQGNGFAIASLVLGIISVALLCMCGIGPICGILAIIFAGVHLARKPEKKGMAIAGLVLGIIGVLLSLIVFITFQTRLNLMLEDMGNFQKILDELNNSMI